MGTGAGDGESQIGQAVEQIPWERKEASDSNLQDWRGNELLQNEKRKRDRREITFPFPTETRNTLGNPGRQLWWS